jgi:hypothetical protein
VQDFKNRYVAVFDWGFMFVLIGLFLALLIGSALFDTYPFVFYISAFLLVFVVLLAAIFGNAFDEVANSADISASYAEFTIIPYVMQHFVQIIIVLLFIVAAVTYVRLNQ